MKSIDLQNLNNTGEFITATAVVMDGTKELFTRNVKVRSKEEMDGTLANILEIANKVEADFKAVSEGTWTPPVKEEVVPEPEPVKTAEEIEREAWLEQWGRYTKAKKAMDALADAGATPTTEETTRFEALKTWVLTNRKPEYSEYLTDVI